MSFTKIQNPHPTVNHTESRRNVIQPTLATLKKAKSESGQGSKNPAIQLKTNAFGEPAIFRPKNSLESQLNTTKGKGSKLNDSAKNEMESGFGRDFSQVNIHTGSDAIQMNRELGSKAFTNGNDIFFNKGEYNPSTSDGKHLLAHELTHTVQQSGSAGMNIQRQTAEEVTAYYDFLLNNKHIQEATNSKAEARHLISDWHDGLRTLDTEMLALAVSELMVPEVGEEDKASILIVIENVPDADLLLMFNTYGINSDAIKIIFGESQNTVNRIDDLVVGQKPVKEQKTFLTEKYGKAPRQWTGYANEPRESEVVRIIELVAAFYAIQPSLLYTIAIGEGLNLYIDANTTSTRVNVDQEVSSYQSLGMDFAAEQIPKLKSLLPADYNKGDEYTEDTPFMRYEGGGPTEVKPVTFKNMESGLYALGALIKFKQNTLLADAAGYGYGVPNEDQLMYWTYYYYQRPSATAYDGGPQTLQRTGSFNFIPKPNGAQNATHQLALERIGSWHLIRMAKIFTN